MIAKSASGSGGNGIAWPPIRASPRPISAVIMVPVAKWSTIAALSITGNPLLMQLRIYKRENDFATTSVTPAPSNAVAACSR